MPDRSKDASFSKVRSLTKWKKWIVQHTPTVCCTGSVIAWIACVVSATRAVRTNEFDLW